MKTIEKQTLIPTNLIVADENQPRKYFDPVLIGKLRNSIKRYGIMTPITVEKIGDKYLLIDGERRFRAATEVGLEEIPATIVAPQNRTDRLVQQFHIQEQHAEWSPTEKAMTVDELAKDLGLDMSQICDLLSIDQATARKYIAFSDLVDRSAFEKSELSIKWAEQISNLTRIASKMYQDEFEQEFTRSDKKALQKSVIDRIKDGQIKNPNQVTRIRDSFLKDPKSIKKFLETDITTDKLFIETKAKTSFHIRNAVASSRYVTAHISQFLKLGDMKVTEDQLKHLKLAREAITKLINTVE